jgi:G:T-mismatch repair DNA endonuclease (very short patch repair protein)
MNVRDLPGKPDFANKRRKFAIFVHVEPELLASEA